MDDSSAAVVLPTCPLCKKTIPADAFFCPYCGKKIKEPPISVSLSSQLKVYIISFFLAPFGLILAFKYLRQNNQKAKIIGIVGIVLTVISISVSITTGLAVFHEFYKMLNVQMQIYNGLTY